MKGVDYLVDESGKRKAVVIELAEHKELWEDFCDVLLAEQRKSESRETLEDVKKTMAAPIG